MACGLVRRFFSDEEGFDFRPALDELPLEEVEAFLDFALVGVAAEREEEERLEVPLADFPRVDFPEVVLLPILDLLALVPRRSADFPLRELEVASGFFVGRLVASMRELDLVELDLVELLLEPFLEERFEERAVWTSFFTKSSFLRDRQLETPSFSANWPSSRTVWVFRDDSDFSDAAVINGPTSAQPDLSVPLRNGAHAFGTSPCPRSPPRADAAMRPSHSAP